MLELQSNFDILRERERRQESEQYAQLLFNVLCGLSIVIIACAGGYLISVYYRRNVVLGKAMRNAYIKYKLEKLSDSTTTSSEQNEMKLLKEESQKLIESSSPEELISIRIEAIRASTISRRLEHLCHLGTEHPTLEEWDDLKSEVEKEFPKVVELIKRHTLQENERRVCWMLCAGITPKGMSVLIGCSKENISSIRRRLGLKLFGEECKTKEFDRKLLSFQL